MSNVSLDVLLVLFKFKNKVVIYNDFSTSKIKNNRSPTEAIRLVLFPEGYWVSLEKNTGSTKNNIEGRPNW